MKAKVNADNSGRLEYIYYRYGSSVTREKTYNNVLPNLQARYDITKNLVVRGAYYASILRPDYQNVIGGINATDNGDGNTYSFAVNNTKLKPETANNFDASIEYYFEPVGLLSASVFYKDIKNIQVNLPKTVLSSAPQDVQEQIASAGYSAADLANPLNTVSSTVNGPKTSMWGFELAYS
ncbi:MAG: TonB-dependent receptor [Verrucomicrobia bacterium]|nr:TonB-dependent receptor [Verrucomicrobiota bacterium]